MFRNFYVKSILGHSKDIVKEGEYSCAFFVTFILHNFKLLNSPHLTVAGCRKDMEESGWKKLPENELKTGCVIIWKAREYDNGPHKHIGFYCGNEQAVSTDWRKGEVAKHHVTYEGRSELESVWWHPNLKD